MAAIDSAGTGFPPVAWYNRDHATFAERAMPDTSVVVTFRAYRLADYDAVAALWTRINRELAPIGMEQLMEQYIATSIDGELKQLADVFSEARRNAFWVVERADSIVGCFGIESRDVTDTELRRMYLDKRYRGSDIAQRMLDCAEAQARALGFTKMILSSAQIQEAAVNFYRKERISRGPARKWPR